MTKSLVRTLLYSALIVVSPTVFANKWYQVELLIFEYLQVNDGGELWNSGRLPDYSDATALRAIDDATHQAFKTLLPNSAKLNRAKARLKSSTAYRPLYQLAWQQPALTKAHARKVRIVDPSVKIYGAVNLIASNLLHIDIDISYLIDVLPEDTLLLNAHENEQDIQSVDLSFIEDIHYAQIKEIRQIKLNELHYFDHPLLGILVQVQRLEIE